MKFKKVYNEVLLGDALIVYSRKLENLNNENKSKFKIELMKLNMLGQMITGQDLGLLDKFESEINDGMPPAGNENVLRQSNFEIV